METVQDVSLPPAVGPGAWGRGLRGGDHQGWEQNPFLTPERVRVPALPSSSSPSQGGSGSRGRHSQSSLRLPREPVFPCRPGFSSYLCLQPWTKEHMSVCDMNVCTQGGCAYVYLGWMWAWVYVHLCLSLLVCVQVCAEHICTPVYTYRGFGQSPQGSDSRPPGTPRPVLSPQPWLHPSPITAESLMQPSFTPTQTTLLSLSSCNWHKCCSNV